MHSGEKSLILSKLSYLLECTEEKVIFKICFGLSKKEKLTKFLESEPGSICNAETSNVTKP